MSKVPERIFLFKLDTYDDTIMSPEWDTEAECEYPAEPVAYIQEDLAQPPDEVKHLVFMALKRNSMDWDNEEYYRVQTWYDSLKETA